MLVSKNGQKQRLIFYGDDEWEPEEKQLIEKFKQYCTQQRKKIPVNEPEMLRFLYNKNKDPAQAYAAVMAFLKF